MGSWVAMISFTFAIAADVRTTGVEGAGALTTSGAVVTAALAIVSNLLRKPANGSPKLPSLSVVFRMPAGKTMATSELDVPTRRRMRFSGRRFPSRRPDSKAGSGDGINSQNQEPNQE